MPTWQFAVTNEQQRYSSPPCCGNRCHSVFARPLMPAQPQHTAPIEKNSNGFRAFCVDQSPHSLSHFNFAANIALSHSCFFHSGSFLSLAVQPAASFASLMHFWHLLPVGVFAFAGRCEASNKPTTETMLRSVILADFMIVFWGERSAIDETCC